MKKLIDYLESYESHDWANCTEAMEALKEAKGILIGTLGNPQEREMLLEAVMTYQWVEGQRSASDGI